MLGTRKYVVRPDILEWAGNQRKILKAVALERYKMQKGFVAYGKDFLAWLPGGKSTAEETKPQEVSEKKGPDLATIRMAQYYESQDLLKQMKWKKVTWDDDADYDGFSKRIMDNDSMFKRVPAFSFMSVHVVKDPLTSAMMKLPPLTHVIEAGTLTNWVLQERDPAVVEPFAPSKTADRKSGFKVDLPRGSVELLDSASADEVLIFLTSMAPRLQAVQQRLEEQQTRITENLDFVRVRCGVTVLYNENNLTYFDDPRAKNDPTYITPDEVDRFLKDMLAAALLYRLFFRHHYIRILPTGSDYYVDVEKKEVGVPANFTDHNWLAAHGRFEAVESVFNKCRRFWWAWFLLGITLVGDVEIL